MALKELVLLAVPIRIIYGLKFQLIPLSASPTTISSAASNNHYIRTKTFASFSKPTI